MQKHQNFIHNCNYAYNAWLRSKINHPLLANSCTVRPLIVSGLNHWSKGFSSDEGNNGGWNLNLKPIFMRPDSKNNMTNVYKLYERVYLNDMFKYNIGGILDDLYDNN